PIEKLSLCILPITSFFSSSFKWKKKLSISNCFMSFTISLLYFELALATPFSSGAGCNGFKPWETGMPPRLLQRLVRPGNLECRCLSFFPAASSGLASTSGIRRFGPVTRFPAPGDECNGQGEERDGKAKPGVVDRPPIDDPLLKNHE